MVGLCTSGNQPEWGTEAADLHRAGHVLAGGRGGAGRPALRARPARRRTHLRRRHPQVPPQAQAHCHSSHAPAPVPRACALSEYKNNRRKDCLAILLSKFG